MHDRDDLNRFEASAVFVRRLVFSLAALGALLWAIAAARSVARNGDDADIIRQWMSANMRELGSILIGSQKTH